MSMTVIFSNAGDRDCQTLINLWKNVDNVNIVELTSFKVTSHQEIVDAISKEEDLLVFCGHGSPNGLFNPCWRSGSVYAFTYSDVKYIKAKQVLAIWCYAKNFWLDICDGLNVLTSSMYISNSDEALVNGFPHVSQDYVDETNNSTFAEMNKYILEGLHVREWKDKLMSTLEDDNRIDKYNRMGMTYLGK